MSDGSASTSPLDASFARLGGQGRGGLLPYLTAGFPDLDTTRALLESLGQLELAALEIGFPYSDSIADGPVIQASFYAALERGVHVADIFAAVGSLSRAVRVPLMAMVSYSIVYRTGPARFVAACRDAGMVGLIVPDISLEEVPQLAELVAEAGLRLTLLIAPTSTSQRRRQIAAACSGFVYYQSITGITGERDRLPADLAQQVAELRSFTQLPVCVGFGISRPEHVRSVCEVADGAIVGSAIVRRIMDAVAAGQSRPRLEEEVCQFVGELLTGTQRP